MDYRGQEVLLVQTNIGIVVPFLVSTKRYGILWDIYSKMTFKDDAERRHLLGRERAGRRRTTTSSPATTWTA